MVNLQAAPVVPVSPGADALAQSNSGLLAVGQAGGGTGSLEFRNGSTGALVTTIPLAGPVTSIAAAQDGFTFYVLVTVDKARSVNAVDAQTHAVGNSIAVPPDSLVALPDPLQHQLYVLESDGNVTTINLSSGQPVATFAVGRSPYPDGPQQRRDPVVRPEGRRRIVQRRGRRYVHPVPGVFDAGAQQLRGPADLQRQSVRLRPGRNVDTREHPGVPPELLRPCPACPPGLPTPAP